MPKYRCLFEHMAGMIASLSLLSNGGKVDAPDWRKNQHTRAHCAVCSLELVTHTYTSPLISGPTMDIGAFSFPLWVKGGNLWPLTGLFQAEQSPQWHPPTLPAMANVTGQAASHSPTDTWTHNPHAQTNKQTNTVTIALPLHTSSGTKWVLTSPFSWGFVSKKVLENPQMSFPVTVDWNFDWGWFLRCYMV